MAEIQTIKMCRYAPVADGPNEADVHPDEVKNWQAAGWRIVEDAPAAEPIVETAITIDEAAARVATPRRGRPPKGE